MSDADKVSANYSSIMVNGRTEAGSKDGLNFVVYDKTLGRVVNMKVFNIGETGKQLK